MSKLIAWRVFFLILACTQILGCATGPKALAPDTEAAYQQRTLRLAREGVAILGDGCVIYSGVTTIYAYEEASRDYAEQAAKSMAGYLQENKVPVREKQVPFICGSLLGSADLEVAFDEYSEREAKPFPVLAGDALKSAKPETVHAYQELLRKVAAQKDVDPQAELSTQEVALELSEADAARLRQNLKARYVIVTSVGGAQVSFGKRFGAAVVSGVLTGIATGGTMFIRLLDTASNESTAMVDLEQRKLLWKRSLQMGKVDPLERAQNMKEHGMPAGWASSNSMPFIFPAGFVLPAGAPAVQQVAAAPVGDKSPVIRSAAAGKKTRKR